MTMLSFDRKRIWAAALSAGILVSAANYYLKLGLFGRYGMAVLFFFLFVSLFRLGFILRSTDQMEDRGSSNTDHSWSSIQHIASRKFAGLIGDFNFLKRIVCFGLGFGWATAFMYWGPDMSTGTRIVFSLPTFILVPPCGGRLLFLYEGFLAGEVMIRFDWNFSFFSVGVRAGSVGVGDGESPVIGWAGVFDVL